MPGTDESPIAVLPATTPLAATAAAAAPHLAHNWWWIRDEANPVLPPGAPGTFDEAVCMNPWALVVDGAFHLYYAGGQADGTKRICLATAPVQDPHTWTRHGPLFEIGAPGSFDARWCVLPHVVRVADDRWHLYYTGRSDHGEGLSAFPGLGLAISRDGRHWEKYPGKPILAPTGVPGDGDAVGTAGGSVLLARLPDGSAEWRYYYTGCPTLGEDVFLNQQKRVCLAVSADGVRWTRRGTLMRRDPDRDYENVATAGPVVRQEPDGTYRMSYSAIGTRWGYYSVCYAESDDGLTWRRGPEYGDNLQLGPTGVGWERQMVEYPSVVRDPHAGGRLRLFYCGNGYGTSGIGTALASALRAVPEPGPATLRLSAAERPLDCRLRIPAQIAVDGDAVPLPRQGVRWHGPDASGSYWHEWHDEAGTDGLQYRALVSHGADGLGLRLTLINGSRCDLHGVAVTAHADPGVTVTWDPRDGAPAAGGERGQTTVRLAALAAGVTHPLRGTVLPAPGPAS